MINNQKTGVGIITYNRPAGLLKLVESLPDELIDSLIIVNDGDSYPEIEALPYFVHQNAENLGVGVSKNIALRWLQQQQVEHFFLIEDDIFIRDPSVFERYINLSAQTGIQHFNFSQHGPFNLDEQGQSAPVMRLSEEPVNLALFHSCVGAFCYYSRLCLQEVGLMDEAFYNALEHVDHTYRIIQAGMHPGWRYFADLDQAEKYLGNEEWSHQQSTISGKPASRALVGVASALFSQKHGYIPREVPQVSPEQVTAQLAALREKYAVK